MRVWCVLLIATAGCHDLLGISESPNDHDAAISDAQIGVEVFRDEFDRYDDTTWEGARYCGNVPAGDFVPELAGGQLVLRTDDRCCGWLGTVASWSPPVRVIVDFTPYLVSGETNSDKVVLALGTSWPLFSSSGVAGVHAEVPPATLHAWVGASGSLDQLGTLTAGSPARVSMELLTTGDLVIRFEGRLARVTGVFEPGAVQRLYVGACDTTDGVTIDRVVIEEIEP